MIDIQIIEEALNLMGNTMRYKVLEDGSFYFYTEEYALKNKDIALHCPESREDVQGNCYGSGYETRACKDVLNRPKQEQEDNIYGRP